MSIFEMFGSVKEVSIDDAVEKFSNNEEMQKAVDEYFLLQNRIKMGGSVASDYSLVDNALNAVRTLLEKKKIKLFIADGASEESTLIAFMELYRNPDSSYMSEIQEAA